jgi:hypothetical protein
MDRNRIQRANTNSRSPAMISLANKQPYKWLGVIVLVLNNQIMAIKQARRAHAAHPNNSIRLCDLAHAKPGVWDERGKEGGVSEAETETVGR